MTKVEERAGFAILLEEPPSARSLWAALITTGDPCRVREPRDSTQVCLACTREGALADARAFIDRIADARAFIDRIAAARLAASGRLEGGPLG